MPRPSVLRLFGPLLLAFVLGALLLPDPAAAQYGFYFGRNKVQYDQFDWHVLETEHFDVYYYPEAEELAEIGAAQAEEIYDELENRFAFSLNHRVPLVFYSSNLHFKQTNITPGFIPDGVGGFFEFLKGRVVVPSNGDLGRFRRVIRHELVHVFTFTKIRRVMRDHRRPPEGLPPLWFTEGIAEYWSGAPDHQHEMIMRDAVAGNHLVPLANMSRIAGSYQMYKQGEAACRFIAETYGEDKLLLLMENVWRDLDFDEVMAFVLGEEMGTISERYDGWVREQYAPALATADLASLDAEPVLTRGFSMKPAFWRYPDGPRGDAVGEIVAVQNEDGYTNVVAQRVDAEMRPIGEVEPVVKGERSERFEAFHHFESAMDVTADGRLAFVTKAGERDVVHLYDLAGRDLIRSVGFDDLIAVYSPAWSPDGSQIAFTGIDRSGFADLYRFTPGDEEEDDRLDRLTRDTYDDRDPAWSPDGRRIAFSSDRTRYGSEGAYNLFLLDPETAQIDYLTRGPQVDTMPAWSPGGDRVAFVSARREPDGKFSGHDLWVADLDAAQPVAYADAADGEGVLEVDAAEGDVLHRLTRFPHATFDPLWADDGRLVFSAFEGFRFTVRTLDADSLLAAPRETVPAGTEPEPLASAGPTPGVSGAVLRDGWAYDRLDVVEDDDERKEPYRRRYQLDAAQGALSNSPVWGTAGGAVLVFSDLLGNDRFLITGYAANEPGRNFLDGLNAGVTRVHLGRRANYAYGAYRLAGRRFDRADPDAVGTYPIFYERLWGGFGAVSYPLSMFRRVEVQTSLAHSDKEILGQESLKTVLLSNQLALVHDNALYGLNGPVAGWRANLTGAYTTDVVYSNTSYFTVAADARHYLRILPDLTLASWGLFRTNLGRRARLNVLGGPWDLRGFPFLDVRAQHVAFTSQELRFPILKAPGAISPLLLPIANLRGALFADAAQVWNGGLGDYDVRDPRDPRGYAGRHLGSIGYGLRLNLLGPIVLRYDIGYRYVEGEERQSFRRFFFGYDF
jgi:hypothetical protein